MSDKHRCSLCGESMTEEESMFKYHGSLGPCPKPPLPKQVLMKVIQVDNYDREGPGHDDVLVCENVSEKWANRIADALNDRNTQHSSVFYRAVPNDYKLQEFEP